jgi:hypothetical protein
VGISVGDLLQSGLTVGVLVLGGVGLPKVGMTVGEFVVGAEGRILVGDGKLQKAPRPNRHVNLPQ